ASLRVSGCGFYPSLKRVRKPGTDGKFPQTSVSVKWKKSENVPSVANQPRLFRCSLRVRVEKKLAHLARRIAGDGTLARPCQCLAHISALQYPKTAYVLLGLGIRPIGNENLSVGLLPHRLCVGGRGNPAGELPHTGSNQFAVERMDLFDRLFRYSGRVEVVGKVTSNQILRHEASCNGPRVGRLICLHYSVERADRKSTKRPRNFRAGGLPLVSCTFEADKHGAEVGGGEALEGAKNVGT